MNQTFFMYFARFIALITSIPVHETAHAYVSYKLGDPTAKEMGRLTLNPLKHFDPIGAICLLVAGIGWAKPVPIDPRYYKNLKAGMALSALAGPVSNFIMALLSMIVFKIFEYAYYGSGSEVWFYAALVFNYMVVINITLGIFNLIPIPPFDGSRIFLVFLPERWYFAIMKYERYIFAAFFLLLAFTDVVNRPLAIANDAVYNLLDVLTLFVDKLMVKTISL